jgi:tryptophanyl-tRNA synthetase
MNRILSGIQPTGNLHLGNYLGAIHNWVALQKSYEAFFCIVDLHALTTHPSPEEIRAWTRETAANYIAAGIDPSHSHIFVQSMVPAHTELSWIFSCFAPLGWLNRMTQFKEKAGKHRDQANLGLYAYPVLMAADILVYKATHVPVGEDQKQHLELTRDIAGAFNHRYKRDFFKLPEPLILGPATRVMSLKEGTVKMSKSDPSDYSRIHLMDDADTIALKIRKAKTDPELLAGTPEAMKNRPEALNLLNIYGALSNTSLEKACPHFEGKSFSVLKAELTDLLVATLIPLQERKKDLMKDPLYLDTILKKGAEKANTLAQHTLSEVKDMIGLLKN